MARLGDTKPCKFCGGDSVLHLVQLAAATLGWIGDRSIPYDVPALPMWECEDCGDRQLLDGELED